MRVSRSDPRVIAQESAVARQQGVLRLMIEMMSQPFLEMPKDVMADYLDHVPRLAVKLYDEMVAELEK